MSAGARVELRAADLHPALDDPALRSMTFLNEVSARFPEAISFAAGRPTEDFFAVDDVHRYLDRFRRHLAEELGHPPAVVTRTLLQYGRTKGIVHELIARNLAVDEDVHVDPEAVVVTVGAQEALYLCLRALRVDARDAVLAVSPTYVGLVGAARLAEMTVLPVAGGPGGIDFEDLSAVLRRAASDGIRVRACYVVPDFANPSGIRASPTGGGCCTSPARRTCCCWRTTPTTATTDRYLWPGVSRGCGGDVVRMIWRAGDGGGLVGWFRRVHGSVCWAVCPG